MRTEILYRVYQGISMFLNAVSLLLVAYALLSWFVRPDTPIYRTLGRLCKPLLAPFRSLSMRLMRYGLRVDISVLLALLVIRLLQNVLYRMMLLLL